MMRDDFCAFILTHGRPDRVYTYKTLRESGYTGKIYIVIDDEDESADEYRKRYGDEVLQFCKKDVAEWTDDGDNFGHRKSVIYARNICWELARQVGCKYFIQLDDDYTHFSLRFGSRGKVYTTRIKIPIDEILNEYLNFLINTPFYTIALAQGGDYIGGPQSSGIKIKRKAMNTFICSIEKPFYFWGRMNEYVTTYVLGAIRGMLFGTATHAYVVQLTTQQNLGGWTEYYLDVGTYIKTFYSIMYAPSCIKVGVLADYGRWKSPHYRIHHQINWNKTAPKILREEWKKEAAHG